MQDEPVLSTIPALAAAPGEEINLTELFRELSLACRRAISAQLKVAESLQGKVNSLIMPCRDLTAFVVLQFFLSRILYVVVWWESQPAVQQMLSLTFSHCATSHYPGQLLLLFWQRRKLGEVSCHAGRR